MVITVDECLITSAEHSHVIVPAQYVNDVMHIDEHVGLNRYCN